MASREERLTRTFVELADSLVDRFDIVDLLTLLTERSVDIFDVDAAGLLMSDTRGELRLMAATSETIELVELIQLQADQGPCLDCFRGGAPVLVADLGGSAERWPRFAPEAMSVGFSAVHALPLRLRGKVLGALNLFRTTPGGLDHADATAAQALADVATVALLQHRAVSEAQTLAEQLQDALNSRVSIEQAKGVLAAQADLGMDEAFLRLRAYARAHQRLLTEVAEDIVAGRLAADRLTT
jgi:transcriptional regulator with GAF, ATPase, and Fis domain